MVPRTILTRSGLILVNAVRPVNNVQSRTVVNNAGPMKNVITNAYSTARRPFNKITVANNSNFTKKVTTVKGTRVNTTRPKAVISAVKGSKGNAVKASACWGNPQQDLKNKRVIDSGCSSVLFTDTECVVLSPDFKLTDESHVLLKVPRKDNMYSVDLKNDIPQGCLTCVFAKATPDESNLWHRRLGHVNFKTMNKLVRENLVSRREFSVARNPQQNGVAKRKIRTRIEVARTYAIGFKKLPSRKLALSFMRPFGCPVTILNIIDHLGSRPNWLFDIDALTNSMNYNPVVAGNQSNGNADPPFSSNSKDSPDAGFKPSGEEEKKDVEDPGNKDSKVSSTEVPKVNQEKDANVNNTNNINTVSPTDNAAGIKDNVVDENIAYGCADDPNMLDLEEIGRFSDAEDDDSGADMNNLDTYFQVSLVPTTRIHKDHPIEQIIGDLNSTHQTRRMTKNLEEHGFLSTTLEQRRNHKDI
ncbi:ribonuclease H-like domain-containing protein [Tanacetum coccineum]